MSKIMVDEMPYFDDSCPFFAGFHGECTIKHAPCVLTNNCGAECPYLVAPTLGVL